MTMFEDREKAFEAKYLHDEELRFRVMCRRNRLIGLWAAEQLGLSGEAADAYVRSMITAQFGEGVCPDIHDRLHADLNAKGVDLSDHRLRRKLEELHAAAHRQIMSEPAAGG